MRYRHDETANSKSMTFHDDATPKSLAVTSVYDIEKKMFHTVADYRNGLIAERLWPTVAAAMVAKAVRFAAHMAALSDRVAEIHQHMTRAE